MRHECDYAGAAPATVSGERLSYRVTGAERRPGIRVPEAALTADESRKVLVNHIGFSGEHACGKPG